MIDFFWLNQGLAGRKFHVPYSIKEVQKKWAQITEKLIYSNGSIRTVEQWQVVRIKINFIYIQDIYNNISVLNFVT